jgi:hypothetical protein
MDDSTIKYPRHLIVAGIFEAWAGLLTKHPPGVKTPGYVEAR